MRLPPLLAAAGVAVSIWAVGFHHHAGRSAVAEAVAPPVAIHQPAAIPPLRPSVLAIESQAIPTPRGVRVTWCASQDLCER